MDDFIIISRGENRDAFFDGKPDRLYFDDAPVESLIGLSDAKLDPSPASALGQLETAAGSSDCVNAVAAILLRDRKYLEQIGYHSGLEIRIWDILQSAEDSGVISRVSMCHEILGALAAKDGRVGEALERYQQSFGAYLSLAVIDRGELVDTLCRFKKFLDAIGRREDWPRMKLDILMKASWKNKQFQEYRSLVLEMYKLGEFGIAEKAYERLIEEGFSLASNYCHLARLRITMGRLEEGEKALESAVAVSRNCESYVLARMCFFKVLFKFLKNLSARSELRELDSILKTSEAHLTWEIDEMLNQVRKSVSDKQYTLLRVLGNALQSASNMPDLNDNLIWKFSVGEEVSQLDLPGLRWRLR